MVKKFYTIEVDDENLKNTAKSKSVKTDKSVSEKEVESFGIVEINNSSSKCKVRNTKDVGFEKNVTNCGKKTIKAQVSQVVDYFDFSFRPEAEVKEEKVATKKCTKKATAKTTTKAKTATKTAKKTTTVLKIDEEKIEAERSINLAVEVCERTDDQAEKIVSVARLGSLFG